MFSTLLIFIILGIFAGILAGLLGIGGGLVIVPILVFTLPPLGIPEVHLMHIALGTSLASIIFTSISSMRSHNKRGAVRWDIFKSITPGIILGTFLGSLSTSFMNTNFLKGIFVVFLYYVASQMLFGLKPKASRKVPEAKGMFVAGNVIGIFSSLVGIGGGTLSVPFLTMCNIVIHTAIGTAAAIGLPIAIAGTRRIRLDRYRRGRPAQLLYRLCIPNCFDRDCFCKYADRAHRCTSGAQPTR